MSGNLDTLLADCEARLEQDEEVLADTRDKLHERDERITQLERT